MEISLPLPSGLSPGIKRTTVQPGPKAPEELVALQERSRPASQETLGPFHGSSLRNEAAPRQKLEEEAGKGRCQASRSLEGWPLRTSQPLGNPPLRPAAWAPASALSSLLLCLPCLSGAYTLVGLAARLGRRSLPSPSGRHSSEIRVVTLSLSKPVSACLGRFHDPGAPGSHTCLPQGSCLALPVSPHGWVACLA